MTRTLILMRHAKSSWGSPDRSDHARPLSDRGRRSATALGDWLRSAGLCPDQVISSSSRRTRESFDRLRISAPASFTDRLYLGGPPEMLAQLRQARGGIVLMLGHNPGIAEFAAAILGDPPEHPRFHDYPTGATLVADFDIAEWSALAWGGGHPRAFVIPRELMAQ
jgi:phosphohistidine phosphatase